MKIGDTLRSRSSPAIANGDGEAVVLETRRTPKPARLGRRLNEPFCKQKGSNHENHKKHGNQKVAVFFGDPSEIRTPDPLIKSQMLCQLS